MSGVRFHFHTLGCKVNQYDSQALRTEFHEAPFLSATREPLDVHVINTCSVTAESDRKSRQTVRRVIRENPEAFVVVAGCYATASPREVAAIPGVRLVLRNDEPAAQKAALAAALAELGYDLDLSLPRPGGLTRFGERTRAFVKIGDGCDQYCSFCRIPFTRGRPRSRTPDEITREVAALVARGYREIVLCAIKMGIYGRDLGANLVGLLRRLLDTTGIERIRLSSLEANDVSRELMDLLAAEPRLCPHLHLPLQSGSDRVLELMQRPYRRAEFDALVGYGRASVAHFVATTDLMVGFPGETEQDFAASLSALEELGFGKTHLFRYSARRGTRAHRMPGQIAPEEKDRRRARAEAAAACARRAVLSAQLGRTLRVLVESRQDGAWWGHAENYVPVSITTTSAQDLRNRFVEVVVEAVEEDAVSGRALEGTAAGAG